MNNSPAMDNWTMPEPVFRSSEGLSPKENTAMEVADVETLVDDVNVEDQPIAAPFRQGVRLKENGKRRHKKKKRTQSKFMRGLALTVGLAVGGVILAAIYFIFR